jgi:hypothetical protein
MSLKDLTSVAEMLRGYDGFGPCEVDVEDLGALKLQVTYEPKEGESATWPYVASARACAEGSLPWRGSLSRRRPRESEARYSRLVHVKTCPQTCPRSPSEARISANASRLENENPSGGSGIPEGHGPAAAIKSPTLYPTDLHARAVIVGGQNCAWRNMPRNVPATAPLVSAASDMPGDNFVDCGEGRHQSRCVDEQLTDCGLGGRLDALAQDGAPQQLQGEFVVRLLPSPGQLRETLLIDVEAVEASLHSR